MFQDQTKCPANVQFLEQIKTERPEYESYMLGQTEIKYP